MKKNIPIIAAVAVFLAGLAVFLLWKPAPPPEPAVVQAPPPEPAIRQVIEAPPAEASLPGLGESDRFVLDALAGLIGDKSLMNIFRTERIIRHIVATIDNLPQRRAPMSVMPIEPAPGRFLVTDKEGGPTVSPKNAARYAAHMKFVELADTKKLVALYARLYPLFQQAYEELGYPKQYFNDRLIVALDDLLAAPDIREPVRLVQPGVHYQFADPDLEARSIGQRILMRVGSGNEAILKNKLREIRQELKLYMREVKVQQGK